MLPIDMIRAAARRTPDALAVETQDEHLSFTGLMARVDALAAGLQAVDPTPQSRVGICAYNTLEHLLSLLAVMAAGKIWVPLNPRDAAGELAAKAETAAPTLLVIDEDCAGKLDAGEAAVIVGAGGGESAADTVSGLLARHAGKRPVRHALSGGDTQAIKFTGGSSGRPKGVLQPYRAWNTGAACMIHGLGLTAADRYLMAAPLTHGTSCYVTPTLAAGGSLHLAGGAMRPAEILDAFAGRGVTTTFIPPTVIYMMLNETGDTPLADRLPALQRLIYGGAPMPPEKIRAAQRVFGPVLATNYGQTEAPQVVTYLSPEEMLTDANLASVGRASLLVAIGIVDPETGAPLPPGADGEVVIGGDLVMSGYLGMPEATAEVMQDGWLRTGDGGCVDERGYLFLKDRLRDVIISGGFNVYPSDVEAALVLHPAVYESVVFGLPDEKWGEAVHAAVVLRAGANAGEDEIIDFAKDKVGSVKAPKKIHIYKDLPRSGVGKVLRREVRDREAGRAKS